LEYVKITLFGAIGTIRFLCQKT